MTVTLRAPKSEEHDLLVRWRNENREFFFSDVEVELISHLCWYEQVVADPTQHFFVIDVDGEPVGTIGLNDVDLVHGRAEYGRFLIAPEHQGNGYAKAAMQELLALAFDELGLHRVYGDVFAFNEAALMLDEKLGFKREGMFRDHIQKRGLRLNVVRMAILEDEWRHLNAGS